ncbi:hypothetical protein NDU88_000517 [Pleurodeles waltl]|uniref:Tyrosine-protein kinase ephrin type A/B receptor-like domain-containing protein n=1 Tax=Pleurodeles waltl TaxID=8319 RepID=A0AAV7TGK3_PLEWA|nr:hypothetical protein NDU88_000517 [Pleurodeles waltl]
MGSTTPRSQDHVCPLGHFCKSGSSKPQPCPLGQYQNEPGQISCKNCPAGTFCGPMYHIHNFTGTLEALLGAVKPSICPPGYYCVEGSQYGFQYPCPEGTYSSTPGLDTTVRSEHGNPTLLVMEPGTGVLRVISVQLEATPPDHALRALTSPRLGRFLSTPVCPAQLESSVKGKDC